MNNLHPLSQQLPHSYSTRKAHNVPIRPSPRLGSSPTPNTTQHPDPFPQFPPTHIILHPDDANSKVFLAIGRAFLSVDNRAMTIKDLADMVLNFGLIAQNVSAASQAITTYIRTHLHRCEVQQDIPLLLRHVLSGTDADDDLLPALYSHSGGAQCSTQPENRITNFRRGTMVWYLSRATGAPCPFARAGIRLCDYGENDKPVEPGNITREKKRAKMLHRRANDQACGQKRKRSLRSCALESTATQPSASSSDSESDHDKPPPKVKLTLRLKPLAKCTSTSPSSSSSQTPPSTSRNTAGLTHHVDHHPSFSSSSSDSDSDSSSSSSMSVDDSDDHSQLRYAEAQRSKEPPFCLPPYPRRSISIPPYTPSVDGPYPCYPTTQFSTEPYRRSPSVAYSISSPPPESEDEEDDAPLSLTGSRRNFYNFSEDEDEVGDDRDDEGELDSEADGETLWESPGPRSPSAPLAFSSSLSGMRVKEEPRDLQGMLDAWDHFDSSLADAKVVEVIAQAAAVLNPETIGGPARIHSSVKVESHDLWDWEPPFVQHQDWNSGLGEETIKIKQEDFDFGIDSLFPSVGKDSFELEDNERPEREYDDGQQQQQQQTTIKQRSKTAPISHSHISTLFPGSSSPSMSYSVTPPSMPIAPSTDPLSSSPQSLTLPPPISPGTAALVQLIQALSVHSPTTPTGGCLPFSTDLPTRSSSIPSSTPSVPPASLVLTPPTTTTPTPPAQQPCVSPQEIRASSTKGGAEGIVVHTCQPCNPSISATQIEGISVYQMTLGPYLLLRRIDTDFVNLTPIVEYCGKGRGYPVLSTVPNAVVVGRGWGSEKVCGVWVPLEVAQSYVNDFDTRSTAGTRKDEQMEGLNVFLSDGLVERFPSALKDFHRTNSSGRMLKQFGRCFESMVTSAHVQVAAVNTAAAAATAIPTPSSTTAAGTTSRGVLNPQKMIQGDTRQSWMEKEIVVPLPMTGAFALGAGLVITGDNDKSVQYHWQGTSLPHLQGHRRVGSGKQEDRVDVTSPLSAKEQEIFQELCLIPGEEEERPKVEVMEACLMEVDVTVAAEESEEDIPKVIINEHSGEGSLKVEVVATESTPLEETEPPPVDEAQPPVTTSPDTDADETSETKAVPANMRLTRAALSKAAEKQLQDKQEKQQALRRSKRVADALAAQTQQQQQRSRSRKRPGSRNTLS